MISQAPVRRFASIDSTNLEAQRLAAAGERGPLWLLAAEQVSGRGRLGRNWVSASGNLYSTLLLPTEATTAVVPQIAFVVALAVHDAVRALCPDANVKLKWPNDCLLNGGKVAGILCETVGQGLVAIGCGINVAHAPQGLAYATAYLQQAAGDVSVDGAFSAYSTALGQRLVQWSGGAGFASILADWQARGHSLGEAVQVRQGETVRVGSFAGLAPDGALRLQKPDGTIENVYAGDVSPRMP